MLIRNNTLTESASSILENATYLYESEMPNVSAYSIPVVANDRFNAGIVSYEDISRLCENKGINIIDGIRAVAEANNIDPNDLVVSIDESTIIMDPYVVDEVHQYVISPVSESHIVSQYTDAMVGAWLESGDDSYLQAIGEPYRLLEADDEEEDKWSYKNSSHKERQEYRNQGEKDRNMISGSSVEFTDKDGKKQSISVNDAGFLVKIKRFLTDKPREFLAKCVSRLRETYRKFLLKADKEKEEGKIKWYKNIARKVLQAIDWILRKIEGLKVNYMKRIEKGLDKKMSEDDNIKNIKIMHNKLKSHTVNRGELQDSNFMTEYIRNDKGEAIPTEHTMKKIYLDFAKRTNREGRKLNDKAVKDYYDKHFNH